MQNDQLTKSEPQSQPNTSRDLQKIQQIQMLVSQSFHIFNRYGKGKEAIEPIVRAFIDDLMEYDERQIIAAFTAWRRKKDGMPTPSNIRDEINGARETKGAGTESLQKFSAWEGDWQSYLEYLDVRGVLSSNIVHRDGGLYLRPGYYPPWTFSDFK